MRKTKSILSMLLAVFMVALCIVPSFAKVPHYNNYAVLGDSVPTGYMLDGYKFAGKKKALWPVVKGSFPEYVAKGVGAKNTYMLAHSGYRTADIRRVLDPDYAGDYFNGRRLPTEAGTMTVDEAALAKLRKQVEGYLAKSDLINLHTGGNDAFQFILILRDMIEEDKLAVADLQQLQNIDLEAAMEDIGTLAGNSRTLIEIAKMEINAIRDFQTHFDAVVKQIHAISPNARLVVIGLYNPLDCAKVGIGDVSLGLLIQPIIDVFNTYLESGCQYRDYYTLVEPKDLETYVGSGDFFANPDQPFDVHPTVNGHRQMADQILAAL